MTNTSSEIAFECAEETLSPTSILCNVCKRRIALEHVDDHSKVCSQQQQQQSSDSNLITTGSGSSSSIGSSGSSGYEDAYGITSPGFTAQQFDEVAQEHPGTKTTQLQ